MITTKMETVTPEKAAGWLSRSKNPRPLKPRNVRQFSQHLLGRTFELTHQGIALDENGYLVDGQHRLTAIVETGQTVDMMVTRGIGTKALLMVDRGVRRDNSVVLRCDRAVADVITLAAKIAAGVGVPSEPDLLKFKRVLEDDATVLIQSYARSQRRLSAAPNKLGAVLNMGKDPDWVVNQWVAFRKGDFPNQSKAVQWLYRREMGDRTITTAVMLVYAFKAFNKENSNADSVYIKNTGSNMDEIRKVLRSMAGMKPDINGV